VKEDDVERSGVRQVEVFQREDGRYAWRAIAWNGEIVATDGGQGYENRVDCVRSTVMVVVPGVPILWLPAGGAPSVEGMTGE
jgi:uncharacterized protein YegP (UPF0339 family)